MAVPVMESASGAAQDGPSVGRKSYGRESQAPVGDTRLGISGPGICPWWQGICPWWQEPLFAPITDLDASTPLGRAFEARSTGFSGENLFDRTPEQRDEHQPLIRYKLPSLSQYHYSSHPCAAAGDYLATNPGAKEVPFCCGNPLEIGNFASSRTWGPPASSCLPHRPRSSRNQPSACPRRRARSAASRRVAAPPKPPAARAAMQAPS